MYPHITLDLVYFLYRAQLFVIAGIVAAAVFAKDKDCWFYYLAGILFQITPMIRDYRYLSYNNYTFAMSGIISMTVIVILIGFFIVRSRRNKQLAKTYVAFYCDTCRDVIGEPSGKQCTCLNCRRPRRELRVLRSEWDSLSAAEKAYYVNMR